MVICKAIIFLMTDFPKRNHYNICPSTPRENKKYIQIKSISLTAHCQTRTTRIKCQEPYKITLKDAMFESFKHVGFTKNRTVKSESSSTLCVMVTSDCPSFEFTQVSKTNRYMSTVCCFFFAWRCAHRLEERRSFQMLT